MLNASIPMQFHYQESWIPRKKKIVSSIWILHLMFEKSTQLVSKSSKFNPWLKNSAFSNKGIVGYITNYLHPGTRHDTAGRGFKPENAPIPKRSTSFVVWSQRGTKKKYVPKLTLCVFMLTSSSMHRTITVGLCSETRENSLENFEVT